MLEVNSGFGKGFDFLRLFLAISVMVVHTAPIVDGSGSFDHYGWLFSFSILTMFFALGGFLVTGSGERLSLGTFMANRAFRILPGLAIETLLSALLLGPLFTILSIRAYFADADFWQYFLNLVGWVQFDLPGVFEHNPLPGIVNGSLWTVPQDLLGYALLAGLIAVGWFRRRSLVLLVALAMLLVDALLQLNDATSGNETGTLFFGTRLMAAFFFGSAAYKYRYYLPVNPAIIAGLVSVFVVVSLIGEPSWRRLILLRELTVPAATYLIVLLGMYPMPLLPVFRSGDYSYGIYLYAFPVQQAASQVLPGLRNYGLHFALSMGITLIFAAFSWHAIEKPLLRMRKRHSFVANNVQASASLVKAP